MSQPQSRARSAEAKLQRTEDLLDAAKQLAREAGGVRFLTLAAVTEAAGLHPSAMRRYFESKEELLLELAQRGWAQWAEAVSATVDGAEALSAEEVADVMAETLATLPLFCDLLTHVPLSLEGDVSMERAERFKTAAFASHDAIVDTFVSRGGLAPDQVRDLVTVAINLAPGLWQVSHPTPSLRELYRRHLRWGHLALDFEPRLKRLLRATASGLSSAEVVSR